VTIVVGYVPSPEGRAALRRAIVEARLRRTGLLVLNTVRPGAGDRGYASVQELELVRSTLATSGVPHELRQVAGGGDPAEEIVDAADGAAAELIVIGLRRRSPVGKLFTGSTAQKILLDARCAVLAVKADDTADRDTADTVTAVGEQAPTSPATRSGAADGPPPRSAAAPPPGRSPRSTPGSAGR
jgi:nucleotide-binding universal stress UspA family protein